jgi:folate-dependent phosphoribosylglycinamide formyltransferase PurN
MSTRPSLFTGILSTIDNPLLPYIVRSFLAAGVRRFCIIADAKGFGSRNFALWQDRTGGAYCKDEVKLGDFASRDLPVYFVNNHNDARCAALVESLGVSLLVNGGTPRKLSPALISIPPQGVLNVHPGVLPKYRGSSCVEWALLNGDPVGNTAHFMSEQYDEGPIICSESYRFPRSANYRDIRLKVYREGIRLMGEVVSSVLERGLSPGRLEPQGPGIQFKPIDDDSMAKVMQVVNDGSHLSMSL